jgi:G3E family GTPase
MGEGFSMKTTIVCGLLGSGKTTFIRNFVKHRNERTVVLVNDFGAVGIDGEIFSSGGIESVELPSGCVCCTLKFDLIQTIQRIVKQFAPERLLIEPSGVASPSGVLEALEGAGAGSASVIGIVDVTEFAELYESGMYGSFFQDQVVNSDVILVNKTDLADEPIIVAAERLISSINPLAVVLRSVNAAVDIPLPEATLHRNSPSSSSHLHFETVSFKFPDRMELALVQRLFDDLAGGGYGTVARAKAIVATEQGTYRFDLVFGRVDSVRHEKAAQNSGVVVIGKGLDRQALQDKLG